MTPTEGSPTLRGLFAQADYRRVWSARTVSQWGDTLNFVALALLIYELTGSGLGVSGVVVAEIAPVLLLAPLVGPLVDRWPRVRLMVCSDLLRVLLAGLLAIWHDSPAFVYVIAFGMSVGATFFGPAASSVLPTLVRRDDLVAANTSIWTAAVISQIALAPLAGLLVVTGGYGPAFALNAASYAISAFLLRRLRVPRTPKRLGCRGCWWMPAKGYMSCSRTGCFEPWLPGSCWRRCPPERPAPCSSSSPRTSWAPPGATTVCSSRSSGSGPRSDLLSCCD